eukprot:scaffold6.g2795.t1
MIRRALVQACRQRASLQRSAVAALAAEAAAAGGATAGGSTAPSTTAQFATAAERGAGSFAAAGRRQYSSSPGAGNDAGSSRQFLPDEQKMVAAVQAVVERAVGLSGEGKDSEALQMLDEGARAQINRAGCFAQRRFYAFILQGALSAARAQHGIWADEYGEKSPETALNDLRLGIAMLGMGQAAEAFPLIEAAGACGARRMRVWCGVRAVASQSFQRYVEQYEKLSNADGAAPEALLVAETLLQKFGRTVCEARMFRALSALWAASPGLEADFAEKGEGAVFFLCGEMRDGLKRSLAFVAPSHPLALSFVREHGRLAEHTAAAGLPQVHAKVQANHEELLQLLADSSADGGGGGSEEGAPGSST